MDGIKELKAYQFAQKYHDGQKRLSGEPYFNHCVKTAEIVAGWQLDDATISAALLHDILEDTPVTEEILSKEFGDEILFLVEGVTKLGRVKYRGTKKEMENTRKFILAVSKDVRVILIKLADRLHNMRTIGALPPLKRKRVAEETMEIYAPLAYRLGMFELSGELEDIAFVHVYPREYRWIQENVRERYQERENYAQKIKPIIMKQLINNDLNPIKIDSRAKRHTSLYRKLQRYEMNLDRIYDLVAIRCIMESVEDCYAALGIIHSIWLPIPKRIKDYIALPKPNGYQSLHTTIFGPDEKIIEVQIRTLEMHQEAENGIAAHWHYQQTKKGKDYLERRASFAKRDELLWVSQLRNWQKNITDPKEFMQSFKIDFLENRILVLTPKGGVVDMPKRSTPIDFAYQIHTEVGNTCVGARVNGTVFPLDGELKSGDVVEILTQKNKQPSQEWLAFVKTSQAKNHIKSRMRRKSQKLMPTMNKTELKIFAEDRLGLLKDITTIISRSHINITHHNSINNVNERFHTIKIGCATTDSKKIEKIIGKIKTLAGIKSVDCRLIP